MAYRNWVALLLILASFILLFFGLTEPILSISMKSKVVTNLGSLEGDVLDKTRSIIGTISDLLDSNKNFVAGLIILFSVVVPIVKGLLLLLAISGMGPISPKSLTDFVRRIGKWSMADVMVVAVFIVYLSTSADENTVSKALKVFGMNIQVKLSHTMVSVLEPGFYWFTAYCIVSLISLEFLNFKEK